MSKSMPSDPNKLTVQFKGTCLWETQPCAVRNSEKIMKWVGSEDVTDGVKIERKEISVALGRNL